MGKELYINHPVAFRPETLVQYLIEHVRHKNDLDSWDFLMTAEHSGHVQDGVPVGNLCRVHEKSSEYVTYVSYLDNGKPSKRIAKAFKLIELLEEIK